MSRLIVYFRIPHIKELWEQSSCLSQLGLHSMKTPFLPEPTLSLYLLPPLPSLYLLNLLMLCTGCVLWLKSLDHGTHKFKYKSSFHHILWSCLSQWVHPDRYNQPPHAIPVYKSSIYFLVLFLGVNEVVHQHGVPCRVHTFKRLNAGGQCGSAREGSWQPKLEP